MNRADWLAERHQAAAAAYDTDYAPTYDVDDAPASDTHRRFVHDLLDRCPAGGRVLAAACGTGRFFDLVLAAGLGVTGADQSAGMIERAAAKYPGVPLLQASLQRLDVGDGFDAAMCVDAMEYVPPEEWPHVLQRLLGAVRPGGAVYLTVECTDAWRLATAYADARAVGLPVVYGEDAGRGEGYHHYPDLARVRSWLHEAGLIEVVEAHSPGAHPSYSYQHYLGVVAASGPANDGRVHARADLGRPYGVTP
jgi:SAM-dependent methyltransferase